MDDDRREEIGAGARAWLWVCGIVGVALSGYLLLVVVAFASMVNPYQSAYQQRVSFLSRLFVDDPLPILLLSLPLTGSMFLIVTAAMKRSRTIRHLASASTLSWLLIFALLTVYLVQFSEKQP